MKYLILVPVLMIFFSSCEQQGHGQKNNKKNDVHELEAYKKKTHYGVITLSSPSNINPGPATKFTTVGFEQTHVVEIPFSIDDVFPLFEPEGRNLVYDWWDPSVVLRKPEGESLEGLVMVSNANPLEVFLIVTQHNPEKNHIQYLALWGDFELQRIDIICKPSQSNNSTKVYWTERNAGLHENGVSMVSDFIEGGSLVKVVERYAKGVEQYLRNKNQDK